MEIESAGLSDIGRVRSNNEDDYFISEELSLYAVSDGVGGAAAGEVASHIFIKTCATAFRNHQESDVDRPSLLRESFLTANHHIHNFTKQCTDSTGMGCTGDLLTFADGKYFLGHVGDSRCYLLRNGRLSQLTKDHTVNQEKIDLGLIDKAHAAQYPSNAIYLAVGHMRGQQPDIYIDEIKQNDIFLLCSDGLSDMVSNEDISSILINRNVDLNKTAQMLIDAANIEGGKDNVTVVLVNIK